jgi:hypothetical protein
LLLHAADCLHRLPGQWGRRENCRRPVVLSPGRGPAANQRRHEHMRPHAIVFCGDTRAAPPSALRCAKPRLPVAKPRLPVLAPERPSRVRLVAEPRAVFDRNPIKPGELPDSRSGSPTPALYQSPIHA